MTRWLRSRPVALLAAAVLLGSCAAPPAGNQAPPGSSPAPSAARGGTLRVVVPAGTFSAELSDPGPASLDPQLGRWFTWGLLRCCLVRTLYSHIGQPTEEGGSRLQADLATALPEVSTDGLTWRIHIKGGLHYGPPLQDVEITAADFVRGFSRGLAPSIAAAEVDTMWYAPFLEIDGAAAYMHGEAATISGIEAPDDHTLVFRLTQPEGDFGARLVNAVPLPPDPLHPDAPFGIAEGADAGYGRFIVASGPYMVEGSEGLDLTGPAGGRAPAAGSKPGHLTLVRNPSWDPASDALRPAYADRIEIASVGSVEQAVADIDAGTADLVWPSGGDLPTLKEEIYTSFQADPTRGRAYVNTTGWVRAALLNVAVPPFDDIHVRKAFNFAIDKQHLVDLLGGPLGSEVMGHGLADSLEDDLLADYDPYATDGDQGDLELARAEIARSRYDRDGDGRCDAPACEHVRAVTRDPYLPLAASVADDLEPLGIHLEPDVVDRDTFFIGIPTHPGLKVPLVLPIAFASPYIGGAGLLQAGYESRYVTADYAGYTMVGATLEQLHGWGYDVTEAPPNVDDRVEACVPLRGAAQFRCVASVDQYLMENVLSYVPLTTDRYAALVSPRVLTYGFDELVGTTALDQLALRP